MDKYWYVTLTLDIDGYERTTQIAVVAESQGRACLAALAAESHGPAKYENGVWIDTGMVYTVDEVQQIAESEYVLLRKLRCTHAVYDPEYIRDVCPGINLPEID